MLACLALSGRWVFYKVISTMRRDKNSPIRAIVVDDSPTMRELLVAILQSRGDIQVVGTGSNGEDAVRLVKRLNPDVISMDIRMPILDGLEATRRIMREDPTPVVIVTGSVMRQDVDLTLKALQAGALIVLKKPGLNDQETCEKIVKTVQLMAEVPVIHHWNASDLQNPAAMRKAMTKPPGSQNFNELRKSEIDIIGIASSTGGPATLARILQPLPVDFPLPILLVQHICPGFSTGLAEWLGTQTKVQVSIAQHGDPLRPGILLVAPDDYHIQVNDLGVIELSKAAPYRGLRPSANYLFNSLARVYGSHAMGIILTGMGDDGVDGMEALHQAGGLTIAQDEVSCVVYGMPREAVARNVIDRVLTLDQIASIFEHFTLQEEIPEKIAE